MFRLFRNNPVINKVVPALALAATLLAAPQISYAQDVDLDAVKASLKAALADASAVSRQEGRFVLPLRTNDELEEISFRCEVILSEDDPLTNVPPICGSMEVPVDEFEAELDFAFNQS